MNSFSAKFNLFSAGTTRLDRPFDEKTHARRPSDEGERILRKISGIDTRVRIVYELL